MDRASAEQQAKCWTWWTGEETRVRPLKDDGRMNAWWQRQIVTGEGRTYRHDGGDLRLGASRDLRRAIEAKGWHILLGTEEPPQWWCELWAPNGPTDGRGKATGPSLEAALYAAALAAADTGA